MGDDELEDSNMVFKQFNKRKRHLNVQSANSMGLEPNITPVRKAVHLLVQFPIPTHVGKEDLSRRRGHPLRVGSHQGEISRSYNKLMSTTPS